jgi:hypothetical protein
MNLHSVVAPYIGAVNPFLLCQLQPSIGYTTNPDGTQVPGYGPAQDIYCQCQALQYNDLMQVSGLNIQGKRLAAYIIGDWNGVVRTDAKGGDIITLPDSSEWLCAFVLEPWSHSAGWTKVCLTEQMKGS